MLVLGISTFSSLFNLEGKKKEATVHYLRLSSSKEVKTLGAQNYYVPQVINMKESIFHFQEV